MLFRKKFQWIQIEPTSYCNCSCLYCPNTIYNHYWEERYIEINTFEKISSIFKNSKLIFLQGWGEPFLHPDFFKLIEITKQNAPRVGTATNGTLLNESILKKIMKSGLDILSFSLAGIGENNDKIRIGSDFNKIINTIQKIDDLKKFYNSPNPHINIAWLLLKSRIDDIIKIPDVFANTGVEQIVITPLDFIASGDLIEESILSLNPKEIHQLKNILENTADRAYDKDIKINYYLTGLGKQAKICTESVNNSFFISSDFSVSPCVFMNLPLKKGVAYYINENQKLYESKNFGNLNKNDFWNIWNSKKYKKSRKDLVSSSPFCRECPKLFWI
jgi:MoaA/NifB/PqqE/SkfB family radical SAM enzyme